MFKQVLEEFYGPSKAVKRATRRVSEGLQRRFKVSEGFKGLHRISEEF